MNSLPLNIVAIDISKLSLQIQSQNKSWALTNDPCGFKKLLKTIQLFPSPFVVFEASGGYERALKDALHRAKIPLCLVSPSRVRAFAASEGIKAKTDPIDTRAIFRFAEEKNLKATPAPGGDQTRLIALMDRRSQLSELMVQEKNHLENAPQCILSSIERSIRSLEAQIQKIEELIRKTLQKNPAMKEKDKRIQSIKGVGEITSWSILAFMPEITQLNRNQIVALAGIAPYNRDSGPVQKKRSIQGGRAKVRRCLYMAATTAARCNDVIKPYVQGLKERGKPHKCAMVAAMRKLLIHIQSVLKYENLAEH